MKGEQNSGGCVSTAVGPSFPPSSAFSLPLTPWETTVTAPAVCQEGMVRLSVGLPSFAVRAVPLRDGRAGGRAGRSSLDPHPVTRNAVVDCDRAGTFPSLRGPSHLLFVLPGHGSSGCPFPAPHLGERGPTALSLGMAVARARGQENEGRLRGQTTLPSGAGGLLTPPWDAAVERAGRAHRRGLGDRMGRGQLGVPGGGGGP